MPFYQSKGEIPKKRHTVFKNPKGGIFFEELVSREGFSYMYSNLYHLNMPTQVIKLDEFKKFEDTYTYIKDDHKPYHFQSNDLSKLLLYNKDVSISRFHSDYICTGSNSTKTSIERNNVANENVFYRQGDYDALLYIQEGNGLLRTNYGNLNFHEGDYIVIPRGVIFQYDVKSKYISGLIIESKAPIETPSKYRNKLGQLLEHSPFCERDIRTPELVDPIDEKGEFAVSVRFRTGNKCFIYENHPFDVVGWDGYYFPWILNINDFEPITGSIHQPPPVHQTFQAKGFVICSFVSRLFDFHPDAIPAPYPHSNVDSDEVI
ncbi:MAG: homogentisate 1,2-dioxygenase, partial [SAR202 cluster bacterium]|nr:homogentisate 1,2-dioxygenase [SAR202 cluster bacterium]